MNCQNISLLAGTYPSDELYHLVLEHNPDVKPENVKAFIALNNFDLLITYKNGKRELFNTFDGYRRYIEYETDALTEEQHRKEFPRLLYRMMRQKNVTQEQLARRLDVSQSMVSKYISGKALPGYTVLKKMASVLNCSVDDLYLNF